MRSTFVTKINMPEDPAQGMVITNHEGMPNTLKITFEGKRFQYHMDIKALKIPYRLGPSWVNNLEWAQALELIRVLMIALGGDGQ